MGGQEEKPRSTGQDESQRETLASSKLSGTPDETMAKQFADSLSSEERAQLEAYLRKEGRTEQESQHECQREGMRHDTSAARLSATGVSSADEGSVFLRPAHGKVEKEAGHSPRAQAVDKKQETAWKTFALVVSGLVLILGGVLIYTTGYKPRGQTDTSVATTATPHASTLTPLPVGTMLYTYRGHADTVRALAWSPDGKRIASAAGSNDGTVQVWDATDGGNVFTYRGHSDAQYGLALAWSPDGRHIVSSGQKIVQMWDATTGSNALPGSGHSGGADALAWSPDGKYIALAVDVGAGANLTGEVQVWNATDGSNVYTYRGHDGNGVLTVAWSPDGKRIASGSFNGMIQVWDATSGAHALTHETGGQVEAVAWSPDGKRIASASVSQPVEVWDATSGAHALTYRGHAGDVAGLAWSPSGKRIASAGSNDGTVQVWDAADGGNVFTYHGHSNGVETVAWSPSGKRIASAGYDKTVQVWQAP